MSDQQNEDVLVVPNELDTLKARADMLGLTYHPSIGVEKLREKVAASIAGEAEPEAPVVAEVAVAETEQARRTRRRNESLELVRIRVACMNPNKKEWEGEIFTAGNGSIGTHKKYVPFNAEEGWHVPRVIYNQIAERQCQVFYTVTDSRGNSSRKGKLIKEFSVEILPQLTADEIAELARRQAMSHAVD